MKYYLVIFILLAALTATAQEKKPSFSPMETSHIRVTTPGLFTQQKYLEVNLTDIPDTEYAFPLPGAKVISPYGRGRGHSGVDIKTFAKDTILAAFSGVVRMSKPYSAYGKVIVIRHAFGLETIYSHNAENLVKSGDTVKAGQPIALTGRTGRASTEHLHFETRINGQHFNPSLVFDLEKRILNRQNLKCTQGKHDISVKQMPITLPKINKKYAVGLFDYPNVSLHLQNVSYPKQIEL